MAPHLIHVMWALTFFSHHITAQILPTELSPPVSRTQHFFKGNSQWALLGCYNDLDPNTGTRALGKTGSYITPTTTDSHILVVPSCLDGCRVALVPENGGPYIYAGVENSNECFCGLTLSNLSTLQEEKYCSSPCTGDPATSCGGYGYLALYVLRSTLPPPSTVSARQIPTNTNSPVPTASCEYCGVIFPTSKNGQVHISAGIWIGISFGILIFAILVIIGIWRAHSWYKHRKNPKYEDNEGQLSLAGLEKEVHTFVRQRSQSHPGMKQGNEGGLVFSAEDPNPEAVLQRQPSKARQDGRRHGVVEQGEHYMKPTGVTTKSGGEGNSYEKTFDIWRRSYLPPLDLDDISGPAEIGDGIEARRPTAIEGVHSLGDNQVDGLDTLGLRYVDSRLSELKTAERSKLESPSESTMETAFLNSEDAVSGNPTFTKVTNRDEEREGGWLRGKSGKEGKTNLRQERDNDWKERKPDGSALTAGSSTKPADEANGKRVEDTASANTGQVSSRMSLKPEQGIIGREGQDKTTWWEKLKLAESRGKER